MNIQYLKSRPKTLNKEMSQDMSSQLHEGTEQDLNKLVKLESSLKHQSKNGRDLVNNEHRTAIEN